MLRITLAAACLLGCGESSEPPIDIIAHVGAHAITEADLRHAAGRDIPDGAARAAALDAVVVEARLAAAARDEGLADDPAVRAELAAAERRILAGRFRERALADAASGKALHARFGERREGLSAAVVTVRHLRVRPDPALERTDPAAARRDAMNRARTLYARIEGGVSFAALAEELADDPRVVVHPEPVTMREGDVDADFLDRVRDLGAGELAPPFDTGFGAHVVRADRAALVQRPKLTEVSGRLRAELRAEAERALMERLAERYPLHTAEPRPEEPAR